MLSAGVVFGQQSWLGFNAGWGDFRAPSPEQTDRRAGQCTGRISRPVRSRKFRPRHGDILSGAKKGRSDERCGLKQNPRVTAIRSAMCCRLRPRTSPNFGLPNAPMTAPDSTERDLTRQELEPPSSAPPARLREPAWAQALVLVLPRSLQVWGPQLWVPQLWQPRLVPPSWPTWLWPSWLIFSAPPPWTSWRISSRISSPTSSPFSLTSSQPSSTFSSRIFSSPSQAFSYSFYSFCSFF